MAVDAIKKGLIDLLTSNAVSSVMNPLRNRYVPVFMLHRMEDKTRGISGHSVEMLEQALSYLNSAGYNGISIEKLVTDIREGNPIPPRSVAFTIDDGFKDQAELALPLFERHQIPVTLFIPTDFVDASKLPWDYMLEYVLLNTDSGTCSVELGGESHQMELTSVASRKKHLRILCNLIKLLPAKAAGHALEDLASALNVVLPASAPEGYMPMTWDDAVRLESKYVQFGPHSRQHFVMTQFDDNECLNEIQSSWQRLKQQLKNPSPVFCYPTGRPDLDFSERDKRLVAQAGLTGALSTEPGYASIDQAQQDIYSIQRFPFPDNMAEFKQYCSWLEKAKELTIHRIRA